MAIYDEGGNLLSAVYGINADILTAAYSKDGDIVYQPHDFTRYTRSIYCQVETAMQGFDIFNGLIFQFNAESQSIGRMSIIDVEQERVLKSMIPAYCGHGDSASFSNEYYAQGDTYPLIYVTHDSNPALVDVLRLTFERNTSGDITTDADDIVTLVKTLKFDMTAGYAAAHCYDIKNRVMYMVGYHDAISVTAEQGNYMIISKWDLNDLTENQDGSFTPRFMSSVDCPYITVTQGQQYHDGLLWITSTGGSGTILAINPKTGKTIYTYSLGISTEIEGCAWIADNQMVVGYQGSAGELETYELFTFG